MRRETRPKIHLQALIYIKNFRGGSAPYTPARDSVPWTPAGAPPQTPNTSHISFPIYIFFKFGPPQNKILCAPLHLPLAKWKMFYYGRFGHKVKLDLHHRQKMQ